MVLLVLNEGLQSRDFVDIVIFHKLGFLKFEVNVGYNRK